jgi:hypothetical protein
VLKVIISFADSKNRFVTNTIVALVKTYLNTLSALVSAFVLFCGRFC